MWFEKNSAKKVLRGNCKKNYSLRKLEKMFKCEIAIEKKVEKSY